MQKTRASLWVIGVTVVTVALLLAMPIAPRAAVVTDTIRRGSLTKTLALEATVRYANETPVLALFDGRIAWLNAKEGDRVCKGELICRMDASAEEAALQRTIQAINEQNAGIASLGESAQAFAAQSLSEARWQAETLKVSIEGKSLRAPIDGVVERVYAQADQPVAAATPLLLLRGETPVLIATMSAQDSASLRVGMRATASVGGLPLAQACVASFGAPTEVNGSLWQTVSFQAAGSELLDRVGETVELDVLCETRENIVIAPIEALSEERTIWVIRDHKAVEVDVEPRWRTAQAFEVPAELEGETIVLSPNADKLYNGCSVKEAKP